MYARELSKASPITMQVLGPLLSARKWALGEMLFEPFIADFCRNTGLGGLGLPSLKDLLHVPRRF